MMTLFALFGLFAAGFIVVRTIAYSYRKGLNDARVRAEHQKEPPPQP